MAEDLFEYGAVPKFIDFHNDENEHETSAFFKGDPILQATPRVKAQKNVILQNSSHINDQNIVPARKIDPIKNVLPAESVTSSQKADVPAENVAFSQIDPFAPALKATSNLALFNPSANRVAEKIRRRSQQIQAQPEDPPKESKSVRLRAREPSLIPRIRSSSIQRPASAAAKEKIQPTQRPASAAAKEKIQPTQPQQTIAFTRNLRSYKTPTGTTPVKPLTKPNPFPFLRSSSRCRDTQSDMDPRIRASVDRLSTPRKVRENAVPKINANNVAPAIKTTSNLALFNPSANRVAEKIRRRSQQIQAQPEEPPKESKSVRLRAREPSLIPKIRSSSIQRPASAAAKEKNQPTQPQQTIAFTRNLRSYKTPTGTTPVKPLTKPNPFPFRRSSSRCRDTQSDMDPRIRASVDRLSTPRKVRENAVPK